MPYSDYLMDDYYMVDFQEGKFEDFCNWVDKVEEQFESISGYMLHEIPEQSYYMFWLSETSVDDAVDQIIDELNKFYDYNILNIKFN